MSGYIPYMDDNQGRGSSEPIREDNREYPRSYSGTHSREGRYGYDQDKHVKRMSSRFNKEFKKRRHYDKKHEEYTSDTPHDCIRVEMCEFYPWENAQEHNTHMYEIVYNEPNRPVYRRGLTFRMTIWFKERPFEPERDNVRLVFNFGPNPSVPKETKIYLPLTSSEHRYDDDRVHNWEANIQRMDDMSMDVEVYIPPDAPVGVWRCWVETCPEGFSYYYRDGSQYHPSSYRRSRRDCSPWRVGPSAYRGDEGSSDRWDWAPFYRDDSSYRRDYSGSRYNNRYGGGNRRGSYWNRWGNRRGSWDRWDNRDGSWDRWGRSDGSRDNWDWAPFYGCNSPYWRRDYSWNRWDRRDGSWDRWGRRDGSWDRWGRRDGSWRRWDNRDGSWDRGSYRDGSRDSWNWAPFYDCDSPYWGRDHSWNRWDCRNGNWNRWDRRDGSWNRWDRHDGSWNRWDRHDGSWDRWGCRDGSWDRWNNRDGSRDRWDWAPFYRSNSPYWRNSSPYGRNYRWNRNENWNRWGNRDGSWDNCNRRGDSWNRWSRRDGSWDRWGYGNGNWNRWDRRNGSWDRWGNRDGSWDRWDYRDGNCDQWDWAPFYRSNSPYWRNSSPYRRDYRWNRNGSWDQWGSRDGSWNRWNRRGNSWDQWGRRNGSWNRWNRRGGSWDQWGRRDGSWNRWNRRGGSWDQWGNRDGSWNRWNRRGSSWDQWGRRDGSWNRWNRRGSSWDQWGNRDGSWNRWNRRSDSWDQWGRRDGSWNRWNRRGNSWDQWGRRDGSWNRWNRRGGSWDQWGRRDGSWNRWNRRSNSWDQWGRRDGSWDRWNRRGSSWDQWGRRDGSWDRWNRRGGSWDQWGRRDGSWNRWNRRGSSWDQWGRRDGSWDRWNRRGSSWDQWGRRDGSWNRWNRRDGSWNRWNRRGNSWDRWGYRDGSCDRWDWAPFYRDSSPYYKDNEYYRGNRSWYRDDSTDNWDRHDGSYGSYDRWDWAPYHGYDNRNWNGSYNDNRYGRDYWYKRDGNWRDSYNNDDYYNGDEYWRYRRDGYWYDGNNYYNDYPYDFNGEVFKCKQDVYILFNPWCRDDPTYMDDEMWRQEYVLNDTGKIWVGSYMQNRGRRWVYGQFDDVVLPAVMYLLEEARMSGSDRANPIRVVRAISEMVNNKDWNQHYNDRRRNDQQGNCLMMGRWDGRYDDGVSPYSWTGSVRIMEQYLRTGKPVKYGQCWVYAGVATTICRALGIPCRPVTNFTSAHDTNNTMSVDKYFSVNGDELERGPDGDSWDSVWSFHCWNEVWMDRPDLPPQYGGWQAIDCTYQEESDGRTKCGPASLECIRSGEIGFNYDTKYLFTEINAEVNHWQQDEYADHGFNRMRPGKYCVGREIMTKRPDYDDDEYDDDGMDVIYEYKPRDWHYDHDRVMNAFRGMEHGHRTKKYDRYFMDHEDVLFEMEEMPRVYMGQPFMVQMHMMNRSNEPRSIEAMLSCHSMYYNGVKNRRIQQDKAYFELAPNQDETFNLYIMPEDYEEYMVDFCVMKMYAIANVKETRQAWGEEEDFYFQKPRINIQTSGPQQVDQDFEVNFGFINPLNIPLTNCRFSFEGPGLQRPRTVKFRDVRPGEMISHIERFVPKQPGETKIVSTFTSHQLNDVFGSRTVGIRE